MSRNLQHCVVSPPPYLYVRASLPRCGACVRAPASACLYTSTTGFYYTYKYTFMRARLAVVVYLLFVRVPVCSVVFVWGTRYAGNFYPPPSHDPLHPSTVSSPRRRPSYPPRPIFAACNNYYYYHCPRTSVEQVFATKTTGVLRRRLLLLTTRCCCRRSFVVVG